MRSWPGLTSTAVLRSPFMFQCPPLDNFDEEMAFNHNDFMTAFGGERSRPAGVQLENYAFDTLFVDDIPSWSLQQDSIPHLILVKRELRDIQNAGTPFHLIVHQLPLWGYYDVSCLATLRSMRPSQKAGESDARYFSLSFKEYRDMRVDQRKLTGGAVGGGGGGGGGGDWVRLPGGLQGGGGGGGPTRTLQVSQLPDSRASAALLAKQFLGGASNWRQIAAVVSNGLTNVGPNDDLRTHFAGDPMKKITIPGRLPGVVVEG